jgi:protein TonB
MVNHFSPLFIHRDIISWIFVTALYSVVAYLVFFSDNVLNLNPEKEPQVTKMNLNLSTFVPPPPPVEIIEPEPEPVVEPEPEPVVEPEPIPEPVKPVTIPKPMTKPIPVLEKKEENLTKVTPKPKKKKVVKKKKVKKKPVKKVKKKKTTKKPTKKVAKKSTKKRSNNNAKKSAATKKKFNRFLSGLRSKINTKKSYPRIAQKRGMQGSVKVTFTITKSGKVTNIKTNGPKIFARSAKAAVQKAFPVSTKDYKGHLPKTVNLNLNYRLR